MLSYIHIQSVRYSFRIPFPRFSLSSLNFARPRATFPSPMKLECGLHGPLVRSFLTYVMLQFFKIRLTCTTVVSLFCTSTGK